MDTQSENTGAEMKNLITLILTMALPLVALAGNPEAVESKIAEMEKAFNEAYTANQIDTYFDFYAKDATLFFYGERQPVERYHQEWQASINAGGAVVSNDVSDMEIRVLPGGKAAVASSFIDNSTRSPDGELTTVRAYESNVWQKIDGQWKVVSLHYNEIAEE
jgi:ketosteroid isomerase-like protein